MPGDAGLGSECPYDLVPSDHNAVDCPDDSDDNLDEPDGNTRFYPAREMKLLLYDNNRNADGRPDFRFGKYTGAFVTPTMSLVRVFLWKRKNIEADSREYAKRLSPRCHPFTGCGANDAKINFSTPLRGQKALTLRGPSKPLFYWWF